eukprot:Phypoly_transcript_03552.p2 GENE.Phypoly_transcript_03552~~Phypoly_transcript_03552.p2  ORF type:complete len:329 (-),score=44.56 Phypoly_transcript_03552:1361-2347(-)
MEHSEQERLEIATKQLLEFGVLLPQWKRMVELATHLCKEKEELLSTAQQSADGANANRRKAEFACNVLDKRVKLLVPDKSVKEGLESSSPTLECAKEQWNKISENLAKCNANTTECGSINLKMEGEIACLDQENIALAKELTNINERKRVQETVTIESRKRLRDLGEKRKNLESRNKELGCKLEQLHNSEAEESYFHNLQLIHQSLSDEINSLSSVNMEIDRQNKLELAIFMELELKLQEEANKLQILRSGAEWDYEHMHRLYHCVQQIDGGGGEWGKQGEGASKGLYEGEWTPETRELWCECVSLKNNNTYITKNIKQMTKRSKLLN